MARTATAVLRTLRALSLAIFALPLLVPGTVARASSEAAILHEKVVALRSLPSASFEWQLHALEIARTLKSLPVSPDRTEIARAFKVQVEAFVRKDAAAAAEQRIRLAADTWVQRVGSALSAQGLGMHVRAREERGAWVAFVDFAQMRDSLAKKLATEADLPASARQAGFDRIEFVNPGNGKSWKFALGGGEALRANVLREAAAEWGIEQL